MTGFKCKRCSAAGESRIVPLFCPSCGGTLDAKPVCTMNVLVPAYMSAASERNSASIARLKDYQSTPEFKAKMSSGEMAHTSADDW